MRQNLKSKFLFSGLSSGVNFIAPIIILPYITRTLGIQSYGEYIYIDTIVQYMIMFVSLGTLLYGSREVGYSRGDLNKEKQVFIDILLVRLLCLILLAVGLLIFIFFEQPPSVLFLILLINVFTALIDVTYYYQGIGEFKILAIRGGLVKLASMALIFVLIKSKNDINIYALIMVFSTLLANLLLFFDLQKRLSKGKYLFNYFKFKQRVYGILSLIKI